MTLFLLGLILFLGLHSLKALAPGFRDGAINTLGMNGWKGLYTILSLVGLVLLIYGFGVARQDTSILYVPSTFMAHINLLLMLIASIVLFAGFLPPGYIATFTKHPQVTAVKIWAFGHLLANGELVQVILFAAFLIWGVMLRISYKRREARGELVRRPFKSWTYDIVAVVAGVVFYLAMLMGLHAMLIGVPVLAG